MSGVLEKDTGIRFPHFFVMKASAGSGKTYTLTKRIVQFLLSDRIPGNKLNNIMAITFSNNAAKEMKKRVLLWLKAAYFRDPEKLGELAEIISLDPEEISRKAGKLIEEIFESYADFQIKTIDSFMTTVFKASAIDFGYNPDFDILLNNDAIMRYSFDLFLRNVRDGSGEAALFDEIISVILRQKKADQAYLWDPSSALLDETKKLYKVLASTGKKVKVTNLSADAERFQSDMRDILVEIESGIERSGLARNNNSSYKSIYPFVMSGNYADIIGKGTTLPPVNKLKKGESSKQADYDRVVGLWQEATQLMTKLTVCHVRSYYTPYLRVYEELRGTVETIKRQLGKIFIEDINLHLAEYLDCMMVPDIYYRIGETIFHYLIDEFQDTSPVQWRNLFPLIENSLAQRGSAFVVGDTKQAIYGFRNADYMIMKSFETTNPFPSADHLVRELGTNFRSLPGILAFNERIFKGIAASHKEYREPAARSGLTDYLQIARNGLKNPGHAEVVLLEKNEDAPPEKNSLQEIVAGLKTAGYEYGDIAVLTQRNEDAVRATMWLNERDVPFISYSSLDIRRRKITGEIVSLLNFLDSPTDDLSFATFLLSDLFTKTLANTGTDIDASGIREFIFHHRSSGPLYKAFQDEHGDLWKRYFDGLFKSVGYLPLYDLFAQVFSVFRTFDVMSGEEATLVKILGVVKDFEGEGYNGLRDFLSFAADDEAGETSWNMDVPKSLNAVKVMTIHKAKGLGFPVVIMLLYAEQNRGFDYIKEEDEGSVSLLRISEKTRECGPDFDVLYSEASIKEKVNKLNTLYVGVTRPEEELYVIAVKGTGKGSGGYPFDLLPPHSASPVSSELPQAREKASAPISFDTFDIQHHHRLLDFKPAKEELMSEAERRRGEFIHEVLSNVEYADVDLDGKLPEIIHAIIQRLQDENGTRYDSKEMNDTVRGFLHSYGIAPYFEKRQNRRVLIEQEFADREGSLFRMDRVIIDPDAIVIIDFKTGGDLNVQDKYEMQLKNYMQILQGIYPGIRISGIIGYVDLKEARKVG